MNPAKDHMRVQSIHPKIYRSKEPFGNSVCLDEKLKMETQRKTNFAFILLSLPIVTMTSDLARVRLVPIRTGQPLIPKYGNHCWSNQHVVNFKFCHLRWQAVTHWNCQLQRRIRICRNNDNCRLFGVFGWSSWMSVNGDDITQFPENSDFANSWQIYHEY